MEDTDMESLAAERFEAEAEADLLRNRLRLAVINIATSEGKKAGMEVPDPVVACIAGLAFKAAGFPQNHLHPWKLYRHYKQLTGRAAG